jgi:Phosphodiester glycosidase
MRRILAGILVLLAIPVAVSYYRFMTLPGQDSLGVRTVEWLRENGMAGVVNDIENWWYTRHPPPVGGKPKEGLPTAAAPVGSANSGRRIDAATLAAATVPPHLAAPANMQPLVTDPLPDEGVWHPTGRTVSGLPAVYTTFFRPDDVHTSLVATAMWMDTILLKTVFVPGSRQPPGAPQTWGTRVPPEEWPALVAAFNSGFEMQDARGGVYTEGQMVIPLVDGGASFVIDKNGKADVGAWGRDFQMSPDIVTVRQNLALIVENGQLVPGLPNNADGQWGATVGNRVFVWRSGVGVDANGGLVYVAGPGLSAVTLAVLLQRAGAVRAMELDINSDWVTAYTYEQTNPADPNSIAGNKLLPEMSHSNDRYLQPGESDFFALLSGH